jgi:hypothetical protein
MLTRRLFVRKSCTESDENPTRDLVADTKSQRDRQANSLSMCFFKIYFSINFPSTLRAHNWSLIFKFSNHNFLWVSRLPVSAPWATHLIVLDCSTRIISSEEYKLRSSSLCSFVQCSLSFFISFSDVPLFYVAVYSHTPYKWSISVKRPSFAPIYIR